MNYEKIYKALVDKRKIDIPEGYTEVHHILPRSMGGSDDKENLVTLTSREHFIAHVLLTRFVTGSNRFKMIRAVIMMMVCSSDNQKRYSPSREYAEIKKRFSEYQSKSQTGSGNSQFGTYWIFHPDFGKKKIKSVFIEEYINQGWYKGTKFDYIKQRKIRVNETKRLQDVLQYREFLKIYVSVGFEEFVKVTGYKYSKQNLVMRFAELLSEFVPQNGKSRKR